MTGLESLGRRLRSAVVCSWLSAVVVAIASGAPYAATSEDPGWPCIQRKIPRVSAGMVWAGPATEGLEADWRADSEVTALARKIAARGTPIEEAKVAVDGFAASLGGGKDRTLTLLFAATLSMVNAERDSIIGGIQRYARRQKKMAARIEAQAAELDALPIDGTEEQQARRRDLEERQTWDIRIFEERERSLKYICDQPVLLEQRIFALSREIMGYLD